MKRLLFVFALLCHPSLIWAQCPAFPARGVQIIDALYRPAQAQGTDDDRRALTRTFLEQLVYEAPAEGWTWKSADPGRPPSKDSLTRIVGGRLCNWDWQNGGTRQRSVQAGQIGEDITGQNPIPVAAINHLGDTPPPLPIPGSPSLPAPAASVDYALIRSFVENAKAELYTQSERMFADGVARSGQLGVQIAGVDARLQQHDENPGYFVRVFGNRYVQLALAGVGAWLGAQQIAKP